MTQMGAQMTLMNYVPIVLLTAQKRSSYGGSSQLPLNIFRTYQCHLCPHLCHLCLTAVPILLKPKAGIHDVAEDRSESVGDSDSA